MMNFITSKLQIGLIIALALVTISFGAYFWWSQGQLTEKTKTIAQQEISIENQKKIIQNFERDVKLIQESNKKLADIERSASEQTKNLNKSLDRLGEQAKESPELVEDIINNATKKRIECFALATGKQVKDKNYTNDVCPQLL